MAAYKTGALVRSKYYTPFSKTPLKWIPRSKLGASKSRPRWVAHTRIDNVWEYPPPLPPGEREQIRQILLDLEQLTSDTSFTLENLFLKRAGAERDFRVARRPC